MSKQNWFKTLNEALDSEDLIDFWPLGSNINYNETVRHIVETGIMNGKRPQTMLVSVYRDEQGRYERPIHYITN